MPLVKIQRVPGLPKEAYEVESGTLLSDFLFSHDVSADVRVIYNKSFLSDDDDIDIALVDGDDVMVFDQPHGGDLVKTLLNPIEHLNPIKFTKKVFQSLSKQPNTSTGGQSKTSPNNSVKGQTNTARNGEARPDNYGLIRSYPDLIQQSLIEYSNNLKFITEYMNIGIGRYDISQVRYSESDFGSMAGSSYTVYQPGQNMGQVIQPYNFDDVDGQEVPGKNETDGIIIETATTTTVTSAQYSGGQLVVRIPENTAFDYFMALPLPHSISFVLNITYNTPSGTVTEDVSLYGNLISTSETNDGAVPTPHYFYNFTINNVNGSATGNLNGATINLTKFTLTDNDALSIGPFFSPISSSQLWVNTQSGLGGNSETNFQVTIWKVDNSNVMIPGTTQVFTYRQTTPHDSTSETFYRTDKITPAAGSGRYAVSIKRTDNSSDASKLQIESVICINVRNNVTYPNETMIKLTTQATKNATSQKERKYNVMANRYTISYENGAINMTLRPSRSFADAVLHTWIIMAKQPASMIDVAGLYEIAGDLPDERLGYFDYSFDDADVALGDRIQTICDSARVIPYWESGVLSFVRDEKRLYPATIFNTANTTRGQYSLTYDMTLPGGFDGVELEYRNPTTNKQGYVYYKIDGDNVVSGQPVKPKKIEMLYVRDLYQATDRAILECRKLIYSRQTMAIQALADGEWVSIGDMVQVIDMYDTNQQAGKITGRNGNVFYTSEHIDFSGTMYVIVTDRLGNPTARYLASPVSDNRKAFSAEIPDIDLALWDGVDVQSPSRYAIASQEELDRTLWTITAKQPGADGTFGVTVAEYQDAMYDYVNPVA